MSDQQQQQEQKKPIDYLFKQNTKFTLTLQEYNMFKQMLAPFEWMSSILNKMRDEAGANPENLLPVYEEDIVIDENGKPQVKQTFWEKHGIKKEEPKKSLTLDDTKPTS